MTPVPDRTADIEPFDVEVFFDGACPLCTREIRGLRRLDRRKRIRFTDFTNPSFELASVGFSRDALMDRIRGRLPNGRRIEGVEVFRRLYEAVGFRRLVALSRLSPINWVLEFAYSWFAANRLGLTGRCRDGWCALGDSQASLVRDLAHK